MKIVAFLQKKENYHFIFFAYNLITIFLTRLCHCHNDRVIYVWAGEEGFIMIKRN